MSFPFVFDPYVKLLFMYESEISMYLVKAE